MAGTNLTKLAETETNEDSSTGQSKVSSSSTEEEKENAPTDNSIEAKTCFEIETDEGKSRNNELHQIEIGKEDQDEICVPDSSNAGNEDDPIVSDDGNEEQHSSGSVDEELMDEDETNDAKVTEEDASNKKEDSSSSPQHPEPSSPAQTPEPHSLVGELMNKFGFSDILEYQEHSLSRGFSEWISSHI